MKSKKRTIFQINVSKMAVNGYDMQAKGGKLIKAGSVIFFQKARFEKNGREFTVFFEFEDKEYSTSAKLQDNKFEGIQRCKEVIEDYFILNSLKGKDYSFFPNGVQIAHINIPHEIAKIHNEKVEYDFRNQYKKSI